MTRVIGNILALAREMLSLDEVRVTKIYRPQLFLEECRWERARQAIGEREGV